MSIADVGNDLIADAIRCARSRISIMIRPRIDGLHPVTWGLCAQGKTAREWRATVHEAAPHDLLALGVPLAFSRWDDACREIRRARGVASQELHEESLYVAASIRVGVEVMKICEERGGDGWVTSADLREAALRARGIE